MHLAQDWVQWRVLLVNTAMSLRFHKERAEFLDQLSDCQVLREEPTTWNQSGSFGSAARASLRTQCDLRRVVSCRVDVAKQNDPTKQLNQTSPVQILALCFFKMRFNIIP
jgi:hypothetical protein